MRGAIKRRQIPGTNQHRKLTSVATSVLEACVWLTWVVHRSQHLRSLFSRMFVGALSSIFLWFECRWGEVYGPPECRRGRIQGATGFQTSR